MPRTARAEATSVDELTDEERSDLTIYFRQKIMHGQGKVELAQAAVKVERDEVNSLFASVKAELRLTRKEFEGHIERFKMTEAEYVVAENKRRRLDRDGGLKAGDQMTMDFSVADTADDIARTRRMGAAAYHAGVLPTDCPKEIHPLMQPHWLEGWQDEQKATAMAMGRAETLLEARGKPSTDDDGIDLNAGADTGTGGGGDDTVDGGEGDKAPEPEQPEEPAQAVDLASVRKSRRASFDKKHPEAAHA